MISLRRGRNVVCREAVELVSDYLDGALPPASAKRLEAHLADCPGCTEYLRQVRDTVALLGSVEPEDLAPETRAGLLQLYRDFQADD